MQLNYLTLINRINDLSPEYPGNVPNARFSMMRFLEKGVTDYERSCLYIGHASELPENYQSPDYFYIICILDAPIPEPYLQDEHAVLIRLDQSVSMTGIYNRLVSDFKSSIYHSATAENLLNIYNKCSSLKKFMGECEKILGNPVVFADVGQHVISYSVDSISESPDTLHALVSAGFPSEGELSFAYKTSSLEQILNIKYPTMFSKTDIVPYNQIFAPVFVNNNMVAYLSVHELNKPFEPYHLEIVRTICTLLSFDRQRYDFNLNAKGELNEYIIKDMLDRDFQSLSIQEQREILTQLGSKEHLYLLSLSPQDSTVQSPPLDMVRNQIQTLFRGCSTIIYNGLVVVLIMHEDEINGEEMEQIKDYARQFQIVGGISCEFNDLQDIKKAYAESVNALHISSIISGLPPVVSYDEIIPYHLINVAQEKEELSSGYVDPALKKLLDYDSKHNTQYTQTLYIYLQEERNIASTANLIHIHRNSLLYRINKITEILGKDLTDPQFRFRLILSFYIIDYQNMQDLNLYNLQASDE